KRLGLVLCVWGGTLYVTFTVAVWYALGRTVLARAQAALGIFGTVFFTLNFFVLAMVPFRLDTDPDSIQPLHDLGVAMTLPPVPPFAFEALLVALAVRKARWAGRLFPRWGGYVNFFWGLLLSPPCLIPLFRSGPLAWNGLFSFWIPVIEFTAWFFVMFWAM